MDTTNTTDSTKRHPLLALYLGRSHGEVGTLPLHARAASEQAAAGNAPAATDRGAATLLVGLGLAAATVTAARLVRKLTGG